MYTFFTYVKSELRYWGRRGSSSAAGIHDTLAAAGRLSAFLPEAGCSLVKKAFNPFLCRGIDQLPKALPMPWRVSMDTMAVIGGSSSHPLPHVSPEASLDVELASVLLPDRSLVVHRPDDLSRSCDVDNMALSLSHETGLDREVCGFMDPGRMDGAIDSRPRLLSLLSESGLDREICGFMDPGRMIEATESRPRRDMYSINPDDASFADDSSSHIVITKDVVSEGVTSEARQVSESKPMMTHDFHGVILETLNNHPEIKLFWKQPKCVGPERLKLTDELLGSGTYGHVYVGLMKGERVAVKLFKKSKHSTSLFPGVLKEVSIMRYLKDQLTACTPHVYGVCGFQAIPEQFEKFGLVMELLGAETNMLTLDYLYNNCTLSQPQWHILFNNIIVGLAQVHEKGVILGDFKTNNIFIDINSLQPIFIDYGFSDWGPAIATGFHLISSDSIDEQLAKFPHYARETFVDGLMTYKSDIWALGHMLSVFYRHVIPMNNALYCAKLCQLIIPEERPTFPDILKIFNCLSE